VKNRIIRSASHEGLADRQGAHGPAHLLLMDEPTLGLSPTLCETVMESIVEIKQRGTSLLLSEQNAELALEVSDEGYTMRLGEVVLHGTSHQLMTDERMRRAYLGI
jgi:branched-chain amino acid transport system ATP-binding protein